MFNFLTIFELLVTTSILNIGGIVVGNTFMYVSPNLQKWAIHSFTYDKLGLSTGKYGLRTADCS